MSLNAEIHDQAYQFFIEEAPELLQVIESGLLQLRQEHSTARVHELMRAAHSIKGGAASVGLEAIKTIAHRLEDIFKALYSQEVDIDTDLESLLLQAYDCLRIPLNQQIEQGQFDVEHALAIAEPIFVQIEERLGDALDQANNYIPSSEDLGIDVVSSIFEVDVEQGLERLNTVLGDPQNYEVAGELHAQAEVFAGFGELLNLPGFEQIAQTTIAALEANPQNAVEITQLAIADFEAARIAVLEGDRTQGGSPSHTLVTLANTTVDLSLVQPSSVSEESIAIASDDIFGDFATDAESVEVNLEPAPVDTGDIFGEFIANSDDLETIEISPELTGANIETNQEELGLIAPPEAETIGVKSEPITTPEAEVETEEPQNLEASVAKIEQLFASLPKLEDVPIPTVQSPQTTEAQASQDKSIVTTPTPSTPINKTSQPTPRQGKRKARSTPGLSVRVDLNRLERMNNLLGELSISRNSVSLQNEQLQDVVRELLNRFDRFQALVSRLQELSDQMLISPENQSNINPNDQTIEPVESSALSPLLSSFDSLEMDNYGAMHSILQGFFEEVMQLEEAVGDIELFSKQSNQKLEQQRQALIQLRDELMWARMLPLGEVLNRFPRILRDLSTKYDKTVRLKLSGAGVLVDKAMLEKLYDPLVHLLRNAFDHGIESPQLRREQGKSEEGLIEIRAYHKGNQTIIEIEDDGQGLNFERIRTQLFTRKLLSANQLAGISNERLLDLIFEPGFSTAPKVSELSGRGVGLDVVRSQIEELKGRITVDSTPGKGTIFTLHLPLTLTIAKLMVGLTGSTAVALPSDSIEEIIIPKAEQLQQSGTQQFLSWRGHMVPTYRLQQLLTYSYPLPKIPPGKAFATISPPQDWALPILVLRQGQKFLALEIDRLVTEQELVIKPFGTAIPAPNYTYGCTILGDGSLIPVIDGVALLEYVRHQGIVTPQLIPNTPESELTRQNSSLVQQTGEGTAKSKATTILAVDDSAALRRTLVLTLEKAGYRVLQARNGQEALEQLQQGANIDLVICDIEMPIMNGFEFLGQRRRYPVLSKIPVAMLTSRSNEKHRRLAMQLGADAYFSKPYIEQEFLDAIKYIVAQSNSGKTSSFN